MSSVITLKQLFNEEVKNNIYLNVINPSLWGNIDNTASGTFELNTNFNLPSANINLTKPKFNLPDVNLGNINADINGKVYDDINMNIPKPNLEILFLVIKSKIKKYANIIQSKIKEIDIVSSYLATS